MTLELVTASDRLRLEWDLGGTWDSGSQAFLATGTRSVMHDAFGTLPVLVDLGRRFFVFRAERLRGWREDPGSLEITARFAGTWLDRERLAEIA